MSDDYKYKNCQKWADEFFDNADIGGDIHCVRAVELVDEMLEEMAQKADAFGLPANVGDFIRAWKNPKDGGNHEL